METNGVNLGNYRTSEPLDFSYISNCSRLFLQLIYESMILPDESFVPCQEFPFPVSVSYITMRSSKLNDLHALILVQIVARTGQP